MKREALNFCNPPQLMACLPLEPVAWDQLGQRAEVPKEGPAQQRCSGHWTEHCEPQGSSNNSFYTSKYSFK